MPSEHDKYAHDYDAQVRIYDCYIADVLFGLTYEYIKAGNSLLDVGIGTGISSQLFHSAGLRVYGIDGSGEMLAICRSKGFTEQLVERNLLEFPWPYTDGMFDHVIACGVFHFIGDLDRVFAEIARILKTGGIFAFTLMDGQEGDGAYKTQMIDGINTYAHRSGCIDELLMDYHYSKEKEMVCLVGQTPFRAIAAKKA